MVRVAVAAREAPLFTYDPGQVEEWTVASGALGKGGSRWLPVRDPGRYVAEVFRTLARAQGIKLPLAVKVAALPTGMELARLESEPLPEILRDMLLYSTNLTAECVGLTASGLDGLEASARAMSDWARAAFGVSFDLRDHSGLGGRSRVTAAGMARVLVAAEKTRRGLKPILRDVGMKDDTGKVIEGHPVKVLAKSGTLNFVSGLAGHISPPLTSKNGGRELVFAIFMGDPARRDAVPVGLREEPEGGKALKPQLPVPGLLASEVLRLVFAGIGAVTVVVLVALFLWLFRRRREPAQGGLTPAQRALAELEQLAALQLAEKGRFSEHYERMTTILRGYVAEQYRLPAAERTPRELRIEMERAGVDPQQRAAIFEILKEGEVVRFHSGKSYPAHARNALGSALSAMKRAAAAEQYAVATIRAEP